MRKLFTFVHFLTAKRFVNAAKVYCSYLFSRVVLSPVPKGFPIAISIEPTTSCNLRCPECPSGLRSFSRKTGMLDEKLFKKIIDESSRHLLYLTFYFQGEPYLNKHFLDMVKYASGKKIYTMTSTNGHYFSAATAEETVRSGLQKIIVSVDGVTQESYESYRIGGNLATVIHGARSLVEAKKKLRSSTPYIVLQFIAMKHNENEIDSVRELGLTLQVDEVVIKSAQVYDFQNNQSLIPGNEKLARYKRDKSGNWKIKNSLENHCWKMWHSAVITWDGNVVPCCFDKDAKYVMGSLVNSSLAEVWNNQPYRQFRKQLLKGRSEIDICTNCTEGTKVWM